MSDNDTIYIQAAREWMAQCNYDTGLLDEDEAYEMAYEMSESQVRRAIKRFYAGGWKQFVEDSTWSISA